MLEVDIHKRLHGFELKVAFAAGQEITVLFGPSGVGKSLTLQAVAGVMTPDAGSIVVDGQRLFDAAAGLNVPPQRRRIGYVPQNYALFPHLTVAQNIAYGLNGVERRDRQGRVQELVAMMGLEGLEGRRPGELSGGQQQRVALARALAFRPRLLLLDEPFAALDDTIRAALHQELLEIQRRWGIITLMVTHDLSEAFALGRRIVILDRGRVLQEGDRDDVFHHPRTRRVAQFIGTRNILHGTVVGVDREATHLRWRGHIIRALPQELPLGRQVDFCVRATQVMIVREDRPPSGPLENVLCGRIVREEMGAEHYSLFVRLEGSPEAYDLTIDLPGYVYYRLGLDANKDVTLNIRKRAIHIIPELPPEGEEQEETG